MNDFQKQTLALVERPPPRCLAGFQLRGDTEITRHVVRAMYSHYDEPPVVAFELHANDRDQKGTLLGHYLERQWPPDFGGGKIMVSPLAIRWEPSRETVQVIDCTQHGCSAELGRPRAHAHSQNPLSEWRNPNGERIDPLFVACFSYPSDFGDETPAEMKSRPQDFFDMFLLAAYCRASRKAFFVTEFECA
jgi:hypothetical protein